MLLVGQEQHVCRLEGRLRNSAQCEMKTQGPLFEAGRSAVQALRCQAFPLLPQPLCSLVSQPCFLNHNLMSS